MHSQAESADFRDFPIACADRIERRPGKSCRVLCHAREA